MTLRVLLSASAVDRLDRAREALEAWPAGRRALIVGATRAAADDLARAVARARPATFGIERFSLTQLAARAAAAALAARGVAPASALGAEAVAARAAFDATRSGTLRYFAPVAGTPGFPRALARTLQELRLAWITRDRLEGLGAAGADLAGLLDRFEAGVAEAATVDRAGLLRAAAEVLRQSPPGGLVVLLDLRLDQAAAIALVQALVDGAASAVATVPHADRETARQLVEMGGVVEEQREPGSGDLPSLRRFLFEAHVPPPARELDGSLELFSAPGEGRESVEIARRILQEARRGVRFDEMAILLRAPQAYAGLIEHALARAGVPAWMGRGTRRPHAAGRAFLALLACAAERLSAARFAEYLSLAQVPLRAYGRDVWEAPRDEALGDSAGTPDDEAAEDAVDAAEQTVAGNSAIVAGTLRAPWRWEELLGEASVIGGDPARWRRRLDGKSRELERQQREAARQDGEDSARARALAHGKEQLDHLRAFTLPLVERLAAWPAAAAWGDWLDRFEALAPDVLRVPAQVLRVLADLRPMGAVGPVSLDEARRVLSERLLTLESEPPARRFGRVFVGTAEQVRGLSFRVVFVPGLAERTFPQKPREDPLLLDDLRSRLDRSLPDQDRRLAEERLLLQLAAGAARERLYVSYPRIELSEARARVPSFYALDVMRAATGAVPPHQALEARAREAGNASLAWPASARPDAAIDDQEHDLAVLRRLLDAPDPGAVRGHAHYLLKLNDHLRRSVVDRWARGAPKWSAHDGLAQLPPTAMAVLGGERPTARPYSITALQRFSACPYQFLLSAVYRLQTLERPTPLQRMDPLTRGSLVHDVQARTLRALQAVGGLPVTSASAEAARATLDRVITEVADEARDQLAPAVERVWDDEIGAIRRDLHVWLDHLAHDGAEWRPIHFELAFGAGGVPGDRDPHSVNQPVVVQGGFRLRGAIDLVEEHGRTRALRVTDHKTGRRPEHLDAVLVGGGAVLQPVLYALAAEEALGRPAAEGRLFYCTAAGGFHSHAIPIDARARAAGLEVLHVIDRAVAAGFLVAAPTADACDRCDFRVVCGRGVYRRIARKPPEPLADLAALRSRP